MRKTKKCYKFESTVSSVNTKKTIITRLPLLCALLFGAVPFMVKAQDPLLSISQAVYLYLNPAATGNEYYTRIAIDYRNHFPGIGNAFVTYSASFDKYFDNINSGVGLMLVGDQLGSKAFTHTTIALSYAYRVQLSKYSALRAGLMFNYFQATRTPNDLIFPDMINNDGMSQALSYSQVKFSGFDFASGFIYESESIKAGVAAYHLASSGDLNYWNRPLKLFAHAEINIPLSGNNNYNNAPTSNGLYGLLRKSELRPVVYFMQQGPNPLFGLGSYLQLADFNLGFFSRQDFGFKSMVFSAQLGYASDVLAAYYMMDIGRFGKTFTGLPASSHEIGLIIRLPTDKEKY